MKIITELCESAKFITEETEGKKNLYFHGTFLEGEIKNKNGRLYPMPILEKEVNRYIKEKINENRGYGELNHPTGPGINLERASHLITELVKDGNSYRGKAKVLTSTPMGKVVEGLIHDGANLGVSSRALGSLKKRGDGIMEVQSDFHLSTPADVVADPSAPNAFVQGIYEGADWVMNPDGNWVMIQQIEEAKKEINKKFDEALAARLFEEFISKLKVL